MAIQVGSDRQLEAIRDGRPDVHGYDGEDGWTLHIEGAGAECALAKLLGRYWNGSVNTFKEGGDVGNVQVRRRSKPWYDLLIRPDDRDDQFFVLALGKMPVFDVIGYIVGAEAKRDDWLQTHGGRPPAFFVPQDMLTKFEPKG